MHTAICTINKVTFNITCRKFRINFVLLFFTSIYFNLEIVACKAPFILFREINYKKKIGAKKHPKPVNLSKKIRPSNLNGPYKVVV